MYANYRAVKSLKLDTFNPTRFHIAIQFWLDNIIFNQTYDNFATISWVNEMEPVLSFTDQASIQLGCLLYKLPHEA